MILLLRHYRPISFTIAALVTLTFTAVYSQDGRVVHQFKSFSDFTSEIDTLKRYQIGDGFVGYDYLIRFFEVNRVYGNSERYGSILIKGDSIATYYHSAPSIVGDAFAPKPVMSDSSAEGVFKTKIESKDRKWVGKLDRLSGFYSQNTRVGNREFYPRSWIRLMIIFDRSGVCFGFIKYGTYELDYQVVGKSNSDALEDLIDFVF